MKVLVLAFILLLGLSYINSEITPRFPGTQPVIIDGSASNSTTIPELEIKQDIDLFSQNSDPILIVFPAPVPPTVTDTQFTLDPTVIGGERDIILTALSGPQGRVLTCGVSDGFFTLATPNGATGRAVIQYDGQDASAQFNTNGLGGLDLTANQATGFAFNATSDLPTNFTLTVYSTGNKFGSVFKSVSGSVLTDSYLIPFSEFTNVDFTSVTAIQFTVEALANVDFSMESLVTYGDIVIEPVGNTVNGSVLPCDTDYYRLQKISPIGPEDYLKISFSQQGEPDHPNSLGVFYIVASEYDDLQSELESNENIVDTLGQLPGPNNYIYKCDTPSCEIEITCEFEDGLTYYIAIEGNDQGILLYSFSAYVSNVTIFELFDKTPQPVLFDRRPTTPPDDHVYYYRYFAIEIPESQFSEGTYLVVNVSRAEPLGGVQLQLNYGGIPELAADTGIIGSVDYNSEGEQSDNCIFQYCVETAQPEGTPFYVHPVNSQPRKPCIAQTEAQYYNEDSFQLTCNLTVDPCQFIYGTWYASILLPVRANSSDPEDPTGYANYTITAYVVQPDIISLQKNVTVKGAVYPELQTHYSLVVPENDVVPGETHLFVQVSNIRNGIVDIWIHKDVGAPQNLAGGPEGCIPANVTCHTSAACNLVVEKCHFTPGTWYIGVSVSYDNVIDINRLPITYTLRATWLEDSAPVPVLAGVPVFSYIGEALYDFYVIDIPPTIDTWLFIELYVKSNDKCDTSVILSVLRGELPGGECYARPDFYCMTGDPRGLSYTTGPPTNYFEVPVQRQSCNFMIQTCELQAGPLYLSVYGHHIDYTVYGDNTYYQLPVEYTLYVDFDVALAVQSGVSYAETVFEKQYQHYYMRVDYLAEGSYLSVEACNIQHGIPRTIEVFVNYNYLAGDCPCYDHLYNATGVQDPNVAPLINDQEPNFLPEVDTIDGCATIIVPACAFRAGVWYIGVLGVNQDLYQYTTPIGYTLTVTVHDAPEIQPLILGQSQSGVAPQWNKTLEYANYKLAAQPVPLNDLVIQLTYVQNCEYLAKHDNLRDTLVLYVNKDAPAGDSCYTYQCEANVESDSYCTIVIPHCQWEGNYFIAVKGDYDADFIGRFTLRTYTQEVRDVELTSGVTVNANIHEKVYHHYFLDVSGEKDEYLSVFFYSNNDLDALSVYLNVNEKAGDSPCFRHIDSCIQDSCCTMQIENYLLTSGRYYVSVYGGDAHFYNLPVEYSLTVSTLPVVTVLSEGDPLTGSVEVGEIQHYMFDVTDIQLGDFLTFEVEVGCSHGAVTAYYQFDSLAGRVPGYLHQESCYASPDSTTWCEIRIPSCELSVGKHFFSIRGIAYTATASPPVLQTAIGYTVELNVITPLVVIPVVEVGRFPINTEYNQLLNNERFIHYQFTVTQEDLDAGYHWIVEVTNVNDGALKVFYEPGYPGDSDSACYLAEICTSGLSTGRNCYWQIPYSTIRVIPNGGLHYITVEAITGRVTANYDILIWKEPVPAIVENPIFTLDNKNSSAQFPFGTEVNITHYTVDEPNGWVQFIKLVDVPAHADTGSLLQVFFYRIINNIGNPMSFNVYLYPRVPAGAHLCCDEDPGSCQDQPTQRTVQLTTDFLGDSDLEVKTFTCDLPNGSGPDASGLQPFYGQRCTVEVWPCEFARYCDNETLDWWLAVVPIAPSFSSGPLAGLSYSVQWRTYNIRLDETLSVGTTSLDQYVNSYDYTPEFTVYSTTTENEGWRSFSVSAPANPSRLVIQTRFLNGSSVVYITGDNFASPPTDIDNESCAEYSCFSGSACDGDFRFISSVCEYGQHSIYYITVRNIGGPNTYNIVSFRITTLEEPETLQIPSRPSEQNPFVGTSGFNSLLNTTGVEGENYNFYVLDIDDNDLKEHQSLILDLEMLNPESDGRLALYFRLGAKAGNYDVLHDSAYDDSEACFGYEYSCSITAVPDAQRCILQIPHTQLVQGHYYISVYNPDFDFGPGPTTDLPDYTLTVFLQVPTPLTLNTTYSVTNASLSNLYPTTYTHYYINVTAEDIAYDQRTDLQGYYTNWLRVQVEGITSTESLLLFLNYDDLAGEPTSVQFSLEYIQTTVCGDTGCIIDVVPCSESFNLKTGVYFISVYVNHETTYNLTVNVEFELYDSLTSETIQGVGNREGTTNLLWRHTSTQAELDVDGDGYGNYRYVVDTNSDQEDDDVIDSDYFYVNVTTDGNTTPGDVVLEVWRDDCSRFFCATSLSSSHYCIIDALTLAPCSIKGGRFYFRVENPAAVNFTLSFYQNETTIQTLLDQQVITEIVYPYEYQEYFYEAVDVSQGATLTVEVCSICGSVEAWIRPDLPAGPGPDGSQYPSSCGLDHCIIDDTLDSFDSPTCCTLFLDDCQYEQRGYYIAVRGVSTNFPNVFNSHLYLPAKYQIQAYQTNIQVLDAPFVCPQYVEYIQKPSQRPRQFAFDLESVNVGGSLRFSMALPYQYVPAPGHFAVLSVALNRTVGYTTACENLPYTCTVQSTDSYYGCSFVVPGCAVHPGRYYVWADAPRGTEVIVERWDPVIPLIQTDLVYTSTINAVPSSGPIEFPFTPATQYYRFDYGVDDDDSGDDDSSHFYDKFFVRVRIQNVQHGSISASINTGYFPYAGDNCATPVFLNTESCAIATDGYDCRIDIQRTDINFYEDDEDQDTKEYSLQRTFWLVINGLEQECELHSIQYSFTVQTTWDITYFPLDHTIVNNVVEDEFNFHRLRPHECEYPQQSYLHVELFDIDQVNGEEVQFYLKDNYIPTPDDYDFTVRSSRANSPDVPEGSISFDWLCSYENMYFSIYGINSADGSVDYAMNVTKVQVPVKELFNNDVYAADDDDDDMCAHEHDFYIFRAVAPNGNFDSSFLRVAVESEFPVEVYVNKGSFAWEQCHIAHGSTSSGGTLNLYDFCDYSDGYYYVTVISNGPYYIFTNVIDNAKELTLGSVYRDYLEPGQYQLYTLEVCKDWFAADDRLVVELADVENGNVVAWIQRESNPGPYQSPEGDGVCDIPNTSATSLFGAQESGYNFLLLDHSILEAGTYHILVRALPSNDDYDDFDADDDEDRNPLFVQFRLFPYLEDLEIDPIELIHDVVVSSAVDYFTIDRTSEGANPFIQYYVVNPSIKGYENGITFGQALLSNVDGGRVTLRVMGGHLATPEQAYIPGDIVGLTQEHVLQYNMQSGRYPYTYQYIMDSRNSIYQPECSGSTDWCGTTTGFDDNSNYETDSSISVWVPSCYFDLAFPTYIAVEASYQNYLDHPISYDLEFKQYVDYVLLKPNTNVEKNLTSWEHHFYRSLQATVESARWRVVVTAGEGVLVTVRNHRCPLQASWTREVWCDADYFDRPWMCDIEIPTAAAHPGNNVFFVDVYGKNATYDISYLRGLENCHSFTGAGRSEGLDFCAGLVPYNTWRWDDYNKLDNEASCFFDELYNHFRVQPCWSGVTTDCNSTLQRFACYESFRACDAQGFYVGTCRNACNSVVYECVNWFESVNLEHYNCTSSRYIDEESYYCTGANSFPSFNEADTQNFFGKPEDILYLNENHVFLQQDV